MRDEAGGPRYRPRRQVRSSAIAIKETGDQTNHRLALLFFKLAVLTLAAVAISGCNVGRMMSSGTPELAAAAPSAADKAKGLQETDAELIKNVIVEADPKVNAEHMLAWSNPETGNKGTIMAIDRFVGDQGQNCKKFQTTVYTFMGISLYRGEACEAQAGSWVLSRLRREED